jgi:hypothetical protein
MHQSPLENIHPHFSLQFTSEPPSQTYQNRTASICISPQRRKERRDDSFFFFAAETPAKKNVHALPSFLEAGQDLLHTKSIREA